MLVNQVQAGMVPQRNEMPIFGRERKPLYARCYTGTFDLRHPFHALPLEVVFTIAERLSTQDLFSFWIASPTVPDYLPQRFWRSRFDRGMEFGHLFEFHDLWHNSDVHWYSVFWKVRELSSSSDCGPAIRNRRRILPVVEHTIELSLKYVDRPVEGTPDSGDDSQPQILLETDGYVAHQVRLPLPPGDQMKTLQISTIRLGGRQYISGLRLNDSDSGLGYYHSCSSKTFRIDTSLNGPVREIVCLMDYTGIRGLSVVTDRGWTAGVAPEAPCLIGQLSHGVLPLGTYFTAHFDVCGPQLPSNPSQK
jgi:hypothetical protein